MFIWKSEYPVGGPIRFAALAAAQTFPTIGAFDDAIQKAFNRLTPPLTTATLLMSPGVYVTLIQTPADVSNAITLIKVQGEGTSTFPQAGSELDGMRRPVPQRDAIRSQ